MLWKEFAIIIGLVVLNSNGFPNGAPADTCVKKRPNTPNHGKARSQELHSLQYQVVASADSYHPGQQITVEINAYKGGPDFRGFFIQARDAHTNEWIGDWHKSSNTTTIPECSAISHGDNKDKIGARLFWNAPQDKQGHVYFTGTILQNYGTFWSDIVANVAAPH